MDNDVILFRGSNTSRILPIILFEEIDFSGSMFLTCISQEILGFGNQKSGSSSGNRFSKPAMLSFSARESRKK